MTIADLELDASRAADQLSLAEADLDVLRRRFDAVLHRRARSPRSRAQREHLSRMLRDAELRAVACRRELHVAREALEMVRIAKTPRTDVVRWAP
jgi:hypothetical protein